LNTIPIDALPQVAVSQTPSQTFDSMLNGVRSNAFVGALTHEPRLGVAAQRHADDMAENNFFNHTGSDDSNVGQRVTDAGYNWNLVGENIARGQVDERAVLDAWMNSSGHRANNLNPDFEDFALAKANSSRGPYWVLVLAREQR
jgi:uncharacterized protein YkwD